MVQREADRIRLAFPDVGRAELDAVATVLESGMLTMGPRVVEFEEEVARACDVAHAVAVSSGTAALHLAVLALGLQPETLEGARVFVLPNPSGRNANFSYLEMLAAFSSLKAQLSRLKTKTDRHRLRLET